jgi:adenylylsulfate kinase
MTGSGSVVWILGLPSAGKSTLASSLARRMREEGLPALLLDGDEVRGALDPAPGFDEPSRAAFYRTLARLAALAAGQGLVAIVAATSNLRVHRDEARRHWPELLEVFVDVPLEECERRDAKGLYAKARRGEAPSLPGVGDAFERPVAPDIRATGGDDPAVVEEILRRLRAQAPRLGARSRCLPPPPGAGRRSGRRPR